ncbi:MAG: GrpB family protein [Syntrophomonas sp.]
MGLAYYRVELHPYDKEWIELFQNEKALIEYNTIGRELYIEHVGSTSIPGMVSKPIVDILVGITDITQNQINDYIDILDTIDYYYLRGFNIFDTNIARYFFVKGNLEDTQFHLHLVRKGSYYWNEYLFFRDCLRNDSELAEKYAAIKQVLAAQYTNDRSSYRFYKSFFIEDFLEQNERY